MIQTLGTNEQEIHNYYIFRNYLIWTKFRKKENKQIGKQLFQYIYFYKST